jgi:hypothetical protein
VPKRPSSGSQFTLLARATADAAADRHHQEVLQRARTSVKRAKDALKNAEQAKESRSTKRT